MGMADDWTEVQGGGPGAGAVRANGYLPSSLRAISGYLRIVSSGASTVASSVRSAASAASAIVDRIDDARRDQVLWAGFDKLESEGGVIRLVLLLGFRSGFQVWDVEEAHNVRDLVSRHDGPVSFLHMLPKPLETIMSKDKFSDSRPLLVFRSDASASIDSIIQDGRSACGGNGANRDDRCDLVPYVVRFYSLSSQSYVHILTFKSAVFSIRSSARVIAISQSTQIHCFNSATLEKDYTVLTNPIDSFPGCGGYGPLAVGPRWLAYSGSPAVLSDSGRVNPQHLQPSRTFPSPASNGSLVAYYALESSKQLAAGLMTLGDIGYKKLSQYYSELRPDSCHPLQSGSPGRKSNRTRNFNLLDADSLGMVIIRDVVSKSIISQFRAHRSPISALCFDPSGILLVTASVQGHSINVFRIVPGLPINSSKSDPENSYMHLYRLQRGLTNAVIEDISFSDDSRWIMVSSSRGTNHLFAISPSGGAVVIQSFDSSLKDNRLGDNSNSTLRWPNNSDQDMNQSTIRASGPPVTLSSISRIRTGSSGWKGTVTGAAAAATGMNGPLSGAIAASFHHCKGGGMHGQAYTLKAKYHLLVFSPSGSLVKYELHLLSGLDSTADARITSPYDSLSTGIESKLIVEAIQKWNVCHKQVRREREDNTDIYGEDAVCDSGKMFIEGSRKVNSVYPVNRCNTSISRTKMIPVERNHLYISEAELQMHQERTPLWAKPKIHLLSMMASSGNLLSETTAVGEIEIEKVPTRPIEARPRSLIPVFSHLQGPNF